MLDKDSARKIALAYAAEVVRTLQPSAVILFGSYANGTPNDDSDIDIAVIMNGFDGDWLDTASMLHGLAWQIGLGIEPHLLDEAMDPSGFVEHVKKTGEVLYQAA